MAKLMKVNGSHTINGDKKSRPSVRKRFGKYKNCLAAVALIMGLACIACGILVLLFFNDLVDYYIKSELTLKEGSEIAKVWAKPPIKPYLKFYFFNVTNHRRFLNGHKPRLQEVGPFTYEEVWEKVNVSWSEDGETVTFGQKKTFFFKKEFSCDSCSEDTNLTLPNMPMLGALAFVANVPGEEGKLVRTAMGSLMEILKQEPFQTISVKDLLWGHQNDLIELSRGFQPEGEGYPHEEFGLFVGKNGTIPGLMTSLTGKTDVYKLGQVLEWDHESKLDFWRKGSECNTIKGSDGSSFRPDLSRNDTIHIFNRELCRSLPLVYQEDITSAVDGCELSGYRFVPPENVFAPPSENPDNACFCLLDDGCKDLPKGLFNMSACFFDSPVFMSWPHFYQADPKLLEEVEGLSPSKEKHQFSIDIQPKLGVSLGARVKSQLNIRMMKMDGIKQAEGLRDIFFPYVWFSDGIESIDDEKTINLLCTAVNTPETARSVMYPTFFVIGVVLILLFALFLGYHNFSVRTEEITPRRSKDENGGHYEMRPTSNGVVLASSS